MSYVIAARIKKTKKEIQVNFINQKHFKKISSKQNDLIQAKIITRSTGGRTGYLSQQ